MTSYQARMLELPGGRRLAYDDVGAPDGAPVFYFHGAPSARAEWRMWTDVAMLRRLDVRLIALDRPGVGASTLQPERRLTDWPADVLALADALGIARFHVLGYSGGGPYAAVCANRIPERLLDTALVSSVASFDVPGALEGIAPGNTQFLKMACDNPWLFRLVYAELGLMAAIAPGIYRQRTLAAFDGPDAAAFARKQVYTALMASKGSSRGEQVDAALVVSPWEFDLKAIQVPVQLWQGEQDHNVSRAMYLYLLESIRGACARLVPDEGHISLIVNHAEEILRSLVGH